MTSYFSSLLFLGVLVGVAWWLRRHKARMAGGEGASGPKERVVSVLSLGSHQKLVTVEVGRAGHRQCLVLGLTGQNIQLLHAYPGTDDALQSDAREVGRGDARRGLDSGVRA